MLWAYQGYNGPSPEESLEDAPLSPVDVVGEGHPLADGVKMGSGELRNIHFIAMEDVGRLHPGPSGINPEALAAGFKPLRSSDDWTTLTYPQPDNVHRPNHYARFKIEPIYFIIENNLPFWAGNVIKYVCREDAKNGLEDLRKARRYLDMEIKRREGDPKWSL